MCGQKWASMRKNQLSSMRGVGSPVYPCVQRPSDALSCWPNSWVSNLHEQMQLRPSLMARVSPSLFCTVLQSLCILSIYGAGMGEDNISPKACLTHSSFGKNIQTSFSFCSLSDTRQQTSIFQITNHTEGLVQWERSNPQHLCNAEWALWLAYNPRAREVLEPRWLARVTSQCSERSYLHM